MTSSKFAGAMFRAVVALSVAGLGVSVASAQSDKSMGGMQMAHGSKMDMKAKKSPAKKPAHHKAANHHKSGSKSGSYALPAGIHLALCPALTALTALFGLAVFSLYGLRERRDALALRAWLIGSIAPGLLARHPRCTSLSNLMTRRGAIAFLGSARTQS